MSFEDDRERFKQGIGSVGANRVRHNIANWNAGQASICFSKGDKEGYARHMAIVEAAKTGSLSLSEGPPVSLADRKKK